MVDQMGWGRAAKRNGYLEPTNGGQKFLNPEALVFNFGKHRDTHYQEVLKKDPDYLVWVHYVNSYYRLKHRDLEVACRALADKLKEDRVLLKKTIKQKVNI